MEDRRIYLGNNIPHSRIDELLPAPPPWRQFTTAARQERGRVFKASVEEIELVNAALYLRRPLLITGRPGTGKTSLAYSVAYELTLGPVLLWPITTRSTLQQGMYSYDAIARLQDASLRQPNATVSPGAAGPDIGRYIRLGPLGTALLPNPRPRVLLIDELDKSDIDLPNDLLNVFEEGDFEIPELARLPEDKEEFKSVKVSPYDNGEKVSIERGRIRADAFPFVVITSNGEREFSPAFLRRCLRLDIPLPNEHKLAEIIAARLDPNPNDQERIKTLLTTFLDHRDRTKKELSTDQLLNAIYLVMKGIDPLQRDKEHLLDALFRSLSDSGGL